MVEMRALATDKRLMEQAARLTLKCARNTTVLWSGLENKELAKAFCSANRPTGYMTLEMILERDYGTFYRELCNLSWAQAEEIWYLLSAKFAESADGAVRVFAAGVSNPEDDASGPVDIGKYKSAYPPRGHARAAYCNSVFEKVEGPALDGNPGADPVFLMGRNINVKPKRY